MTSIAYCNPFVPAEWIAAHGLRPCWLRLQATEPSGAGWHGHLARTSEPALATRQCHPAGGWHGHLARASEPALATRQCHPAPLHTGARRGVCPYAGALVDAVLSDLSAAAVVLTTTCDQMRYAAAVLQQFAALPVFLLNVPRTWQTAGARQLYLEELLRLGRFLVGLGGQAPSDEELARVMFECDRARAPLRGRPVAQPFPAVRGVPACRCFAEAVPDSQDSALLAGRQAVAHQRKGSSAPEAGGQLASQGVPLALVGGPLLEKDYEVFAMVERAGGRVVLDATEGGERTLPAPFDPARLRRNPLQELVDAYFGTIPAIFRRPNDRFYEWLGEQLAARAVRGLILRRYVGCDLWHAEFHRLRQWSPVPVLELDAAGDEPSDMGRTVGRLEAFVEMLR